MTHPLKTAAKILTISATLSMYLMFTSANAALNFGNASTDASPAYSGQQFAAFVKSDRDQAAGHSENGKRGDDDGRRGGDDDNEGHGEGNDDGNGEGNDDGHGGNDGEGHGGDDGGNDGEGNDGDGEGDD